MMRLLKGRRSDKYHIQLSCPDGTWASIGLGAAGKRQAKRTMRFLEEITASRETGRAPSVAAGDWLASAPDAIRKKLMGLGLARGPVPTLAEWLQVYVDLRSDVKPTTRLAYRKTVQSLLDFFDGQTQIDSITTGQADDFRIWLKSTRNMADATILTHCKRACQFFRAAIRRRIITENPFADMTYGSGINLKRSYFVSREEAEAVLNACPTTEWRLIFALCRYGGLRCPSEIIRLRWKDVDWARRRFTVHAPKVERYGCGAVRCVPIFPELYPHLRAVFEQAKEGAEYVITRYRRPDQNLGTYFRDIIRRAGLKPWPKIFQNLRSTRQTELVESFPLHVACAWIGNTRLVAAQHYLQVTESDYAKALIGKTADPFTSQPESILPREIAQGWDDLPERVKEAIMILVSTALQTHV